MAFQSALPAGLFGPTYTGRETPRTITFDLPVAPKGVATLRVAINGTGAQAIPVTVNGERVGQLDRLRGDGTISRHGRQGLWYEKELSFDAGRLTAGTNTLTLTVPAGNINNENRGTGYAIPDSTVLCGIWN